ncbi:unnamed protein product [Rotaria sordida]|uniref:Uncharacterized protein n=1 Tax=Rotaria sordida TaxID=392033 RepID=A0A818PH22_9BILA|nr:unnamed protein product [Rotaria sordida]
MSNKYYLLSITFLLFVCFAQSQNETSSVTDGTTVAELTTPESVISRLPTPWMSSDTLPTTTNLMLPSFTGKMEDPTATSVLTMSSNTVPTFTTNPDVTHPSATNYSSSINLITSLTSIISTGITSTAPTTVLKTNLNETYIYTFQSEHALLTGIINNSNVTTEVQRMVDASFNLPDFSKNVTKIEIKVKPRVATTDYNMLVDIWFTSTRNDFDIAYIDSAKLTRTINILLLDANNTLVSVNSTFKPERFTNATTNRRIGGPSPGVPAQLGMGLGISLFGVLLIAEIILFARILG